MNTKIQGQRKKHTWRRGPVWTQLQLKLGWPVFFCGTWKAKMQNVFLFWIKWAGDRAKTRAEIQRATGNEPNTVVIRYFAWTTQRKTTWFYEESVNRCWVKWQKKMIRWVEQTESVHIFCLITVYTVISMCSHFLYRNSNSDDNSSCCCLNGEPVPLVESQLITRGITRGVRSCETDKSGKIDQN